MTMLALLCTAVVGAAGGARLVSVLLALFLVWAALQLGYFAGICVQGSGFRCEPSLFRVGGRHSNAAAGGQLRQAAGVVAEGVALFAAGKMCEAASE